MLVEDPSPAGQTHWTAVKLHGWINEHLQTQLGFSTMVRYFSWQDCKLKMLCPWPFKCVSRPTWAKTSGTIVFGVVCPADGRQTTMLFNHGDSRPSRCFPPMLRRFRNGGQCENRYRMLIDLPADKNDWRSGPQHLYVANCHL